MRNNLYVNITGTLDGEGKAVEFKGAEGVVCYAGRETDGHTSGHALVMGALSDRDFSALLGAILRTVGPAMFARILLKSVFDRRVHYGESKEA